MPIPHEQLGSLLDSSNPSASLLSSLSPSLELFSKDRHILLQMIHPVFLLPPWVALTPKKLPKTSPSVADAPPPCVPRIPQTKSSVCALSPQRSRNLSGQARRRTIGCGHRASVSAIQGIGGAWSGEPVLACHSQVSSGSTSCNCTAVSRPPQLSATAPSTVNAHPGDHRFPSCTAGSTPRPSEDYTTAACAAGVATGTADRDRSCATTGTEGHAS